MTYCILQHKIHINVCLANQNLTVCAKVDMIKLSHKLKPVNYSLPIGYIMTLYWYKEYKIGS